ncbi:TAXI family TRAP transporter solute-binding subunit [Natrialbaceae archaeon AArc-T1-2]|uniref:TAXI family TRAP transporter solute-binding subunit n=1 Tax=Natrialbaceae archaeon AArc-T1-2 TaxID=3053904 RepID=UPI00255AFA2D|nr:TAXI family TRAP transporter solute-binding subunit [Natrialbaceae archaeon AArc-T1-2]WIV68878.1 TAXI family TRAP transporter solute-binding subunit [Natrialbaceae archaeon AArc-T1-2]
MDTRSNRRAFIAATGAIGTKALAGCLGSDGDGVIGIGTSEGGANQETTNALQRGLNEYGEVAQISALETPGSAANLRLFDEGESDGGVSSVMDYRAAQNEEGEFAEDTLDNLPQQVFNQIEIVMNFWTREETDIDSVSDIAEQDAVVWAGNPGTGIRNTTSAAWESLGFWNDWEVSDLDIGDAPGALEEGRIDVTLGYAANGSPPPFFDEMMSRVELRHVEMDVEVDEYQDADGVAYIEQTEIPDEDGDLGDNENQIEDAWVQANHLFLGEHVDEQAVYEICEISHENNDFIREASDSYPDHTDIGRMTNNFMDDVPIHPGAEEFYQENGLM